MKFVVNVSIGLANRHTQFNTTTTRETQPQKQKHVYNLLKWLIVTAEEAATKTNTRILQF